MTCAIVLEMWYDRVNYPDLRKLAQEAYYDYEPDAVLIEKKASGQSLLQDLRMAGIPVMEYLQRSSCPCIVSSFRRWKNLLSKKQKMGYEFN